jgi:RNA polymerase subunit RPABC4/transcription elongation factor Spt4
MDRHVMYCPTCRRDVSTEKDYNLGLFIVLLILGILFGILYYVLSDKVRCPTCKTSEPYLQFSKSNNYGPHQTAPPYSTAPTANSEAKFCPNCGVSVAPGTAFCTKCGKPH